jgi:primase-polymerase (primpol)-like protein
MQVYNIKKDVLAVRAENVPAELRARPQWVNWQARERLDGRLDKVPYTPGTTRKASTTDLTTWRTFDEALKDLDRYDGVGFVFCSGDPYVGVDLDGCVDPETGEVKPWAARIIESLDSFAELSPSGTGVHVIARGKIPYACRREAVEMYSQGRFFAVTGHVLGGDR